MLKIINTIFILPSTIATLIIFLITYVSAHKGPIDPIIMVETAKNYIETVQQSLVAVLAQYMINLGFWALIMYIIIY